MDKAESEEGFFHVPQIEDGQLELVITAETLTENPELIAMGNATFDWTFESLAAREGGGISDGFMKRSHWKVFRRNDSRRDPVEIPTQKIENSESKSNLKSTHFTF